MTITCAKLEAVLTSRCGKTMALVDMTDLTDPIVTALMALGIQPQSISEATDADLAAVQDDNIAELMDRAELRTLETVLNNLELVDTSIGPHDEALGQIGSRLSQTVDKLRTKITRIYGETPLVGGTIRLNFAEKDAE